MCLVLSNYPYIGLRAAEEPGESAATGAFCKLTVAYLQQWSLTNRINKVSEGLLLGTRVLVLFRLFDFTL